MKNILYIATFSFMFFSCSNNQNKSIDQAIESKDLNTIKKHRQIVSNELNEISAKLAKLDKAIGDLDTTKKNHLVKILTVKDTFFTHYIEVQGNVDTKENIIIYPEYSGIITQVLVKSGQRVSKGQLLAKIDDGGISFQLAQAQTQLALAKTIFERQKNLWDQKIGSEIQFIQAKTSMESQQKVVSQIKSQLAKTNVVAPFSGTIDSVIAERGKVVGPGQDLFRIVNLSNMFVSANVPENYVGKLKIGASVEVYLNALGKTVKGKVRQIGNYINPNNRTFGIEISITNQDNLLKPNQVAVLKIEDYLNKNAIILPENLIQEKANGEKIVYIIDKINQDKTAVAKQQVVKTGLSNQGNIEIKSGLKSGQKVVTDGTKSIKDGVTVEIIN